MIWIGEWRSRSWPRHFRWRFILGEIIGGLKSGIPICCVLYYIVVMRLYLLLKSFKVVEMLYGERNHICKDDAHNVFIYWRCPLCMLRGHIADVKWNGISEWTYIYEGILLDRLMKRLK